MTRFKTLDDLDVAGRTVLVRADLNVPMAEGAVTDTTRLDRLGPTLTGLADAGGKVVVLSHFGRPKGERRAEMSLAPVARALGERLGGRPVTFADDCVGEPARAAVDALLPGGILVLENLRFHAGEEKNDPDFARALATLGDLYVNDAFSAAHRAHASTEALARLLPSAAGRLMEAELDALSTALGDPERPVMAVVGGAKISTKLDLLGNLVAKVDVLALGGGMANTFLLARGAAVGKSLCEADMVDQARRIEAVARDAGCEIVLPTDGLMATTFAANADHVTTITNAIPPDRMMLDVGAESAADLARRLEAARTLVWNGPLGAFEITPFDAGTNAVAQAAATLTAQGRLRSVAGGGDTVAALANAGVVDRFSYVSTAGGAFLEWLEGKILPGVAALQ